MNNNIVVTQNTAPIQSAGLGAFGGGEQFRMALQAAEMLSTSNMVPAPYQKNPGSCFIAINTALRLKMDPLMVMQNLFVVQGRPSWSGQFAIALINACGKYESTSFEFKNGRDYTEGVRLSAVLKRGGTVHGAWITPEMVKAEGWGKKWQTMPEQMYKYRAAAFFARAECPEALVGLAVEGEAEDIAGSNRPVMARPLFEEKTQSPALECEEPAPSEEGPPPHIRLMEALSCTEGELNAVFKHVSGGKVVSWSQLSPAKLEDCLKNLDEMSAALERVKNQTVGGEL